MKITYDKIADAMYIYLAKNKKSTRTEMSEIRSIKKNLTKQI